MAGNPNTLWQAPAPIVQNNPDVLGRRGQASSVGNRYGRNELMPYAPFTFTAGILSAQAKIELIAYIDTMLSIWPFDFSVQNGIVNLEVRHLRYGIPKDPRVPQLLADYIANNPASPIAVSFTAWAALPENAAANTALDYANYLMTTDQASAELICGLGCIGYLVPDALAAQHNYREGTIDTRHGGSAHWWIDWDRIGDITIIEKLYQMWYDLKVAITNA